MHLSLAVLAVFWPKDIINTDKSALFVCFIKCIRPFIYSFTFFLDVILFFSVFFFLSYRTPNEPISQGALRISRYAVTPN